MSKILHTIQDQYLMSMDPLDVMDRDLFPIKWEVALNEDSIILTSQPEEGIEVGISMWDGRLEVWITNKADIDGGTVGVEGDAQDVLTLNNVNYYREQAKSKNHE